MYNRIILIGNLTRDPELRYIPNGTAVANFGITTNRKYGENKEEIFFGDVIAWAKLAETCSKYLSKGSKVLIEGRLTTENWTDSSGNKKTRTRVVAEQIKFLNTKKAVSSDGETQDSGEIPEEHTGLDPF